MFVTACCQHYLDNTDWLSSLSMKDESIDINNIPRSICVNLFPERERERDWGAHWERERQTEGQMDQWLYSQAAVFIDVKMLLSTWGRHLLAGQSISLSSLSVKPLLLPRHLPITFYAKQRNFFSKINRIFTLWKWRLARFSIHV